MRWGEGFSTEVGGVVCDVDVIEDGGVFVDLGVHVGVSLGEVELKVEVVEGVDVVVGNDTESFGCIGSCANRALTEAITAGSSHPLTGTQYWYTVDVASMVTLVLTLLVLALSVIVVKDVTTDCEEVSADEVQRQ
jgi:hypothetical protein